MFKLSKFSLFILLISTFVNTGCDALLQNIQKSNQQKTSANYAAGNAPKRAYTLQFPQNKDRIPIDGYAPGDIMVTSPNPWGTRYKDYVFNDLDITTEYYKMNAPMWNGSSKNLICDIITPKNDVETNRPCFIFIFGGGFAGKYDDCTQEICKGMAQKGYVVISADYRVGFENSALVGKCLGDFNTGMYPAIIRAVQDARSLVRYIKANAERLRIDPNKIFFSGQSAGALTTLGMVLYNNKNVPAHILNQVGGSLDPMNDNMKYDSRVAGIVAYAGAILDLNMLTDSKVTTPMNLITGTCDELIDMNIGAPFRCTDRKTFPLIYGGEAIYERSLTVGNPVYLNLICNGAHGMGSVGYLNLLELTSNFTNSILEGKPITGKKIIPAAKPICNRPEICK